MKLSSCTTPLSQMTNGITMGRPVYLVSMENSVNRIGKTQVSLTVKDGVTKEKVTIFDTDVQALQKKYPFMVPKAVVVLAITKKDPFYNATQIVSQPEEDYDLSEVAQIATDRDPEQLYEAILDLVRKNSRGGAYPISRIVEEVYEKRKDAILRSTSALGHHHVGLHGNVLHTLEVMEICSKLLETPLGADIDAELLMAGAALHDIGKIDCYVTDEVGEATMSLEGSALGGHHYGSLKAIDDAVRDGEYDAERVLLLKNIVACHHGKREFGDIATAMTLEGFWLHYADELDAKHFTVKSKIMECDPGKTTSHKEGDTQYTLYRRVDQ